MPAPALDVNHEAVRVLATAVGVREAARQMGLDQNTVKQWSAREGWFKQPEGPKLPPTMQKRIVTNVTNPAEAMADSMSNLNGQTKLGLAVAACTMADKFSQMKADELIQITPAIKDAAAIADKVHQWSKSQEQNSLVSISFVQPSGDQAPVIDIQADRL